MKQLLENQYLARLVNNFARAPYQINDFMVGDAELIRLPNGDILAVTVDGIVEEIERGLYQDPYLMGWMAVTASLSDLAAVGAQPLGILLLEVVPKDIPEAHLQQIQRGIQEACEAHGTFVLGGDTNLSAQIQISATSIGIFPDEQYLLRKGCQIGDKIYATGPLGMGNAFAFATFFSPEHKDAIHFRPKARLSEGQIIRSFASACIDSSDGLFPALANLSTLNQVGFKLEKSWEEIIHPEIPPFYASFELPYWYLLAGPHGEYELIFTIPAERETTFLEAAREQEWNPFYLGQVIKADRCRYPHEGVSRFFDPIHLSNLYEKSGGDPRAYLQALQQTALL